jgi:hypothetical protein
MTLDKKDFKKLFSKTGKFTGSISVLWEFDAETLLSLVLENQLEIFIPTQMIEEEFLENPNEQNDSSGNWLYDDPVLIQLPDGIGRASSTDSETKYKKAKSDKKMYLALFINIHNNDETPLNTHINLDPKVSKYYATPFTIKDIAFQNSQIEQLKQFSEQYCEHALKKTLALYMEDFKTTESTYCVYEISIGYLRFCIQNKKIFSPRLSPLELQSFFKALPELTNDLKSGGFELAKMVKKISKSLYKENERGGSDALKIKLWVGDVQKYQYIFIDDLKKRLKHDNKKAIIKRILRKYNSKKTL